MATVREEQLALEMPAAKAPRWQQLVEWFKPSTSQALYDRVLTVSLALLFWIYYGVFSVITNG